MYLIADIFTYQLILHHHDDDDDDDDDDDELILILGKMVTSMFKMMSL